MLVLKTSKLVNKAIAIKSERFLNKTKIKIKIGQLKTIRTFLGWCKIQNTILFEFCLKTDIVLNYNKKEEDNNDYRLLY